MSRRGWAAIVACVVLPIACTRTSAHASEPAPLSMPAPERVALAASVEGTWRTSTLVGDSITVTTELNLDHGVATEVRRVSPMFGGGENTVTLAASGHYAITESGLLELSLSSSEGRRRRVRSTASLIGDPGGLFVGAYVPLGSEGRAFRYEESTRDSEAQPPGPRHAVVDVDFSEPLARIATERSRCGVDLSIYADLGTAATTERHMMSCHAVFRSNLELVEIVIDEFRSRGAEVPFVSDLRQREGDSDLATFLERAVDRSLYVDPKRPDVLLRAAVGIGTTGFGWLRVGG